MKTLIRWAGALALVAAASPCLAQTRAKVYLDAAGHPQTAIGTFCVPASDGSGCSGGGGGGGGSTTTTSTAAAPTYTEGQTTAPFSTNLSGDLRTIAKQSGAWTTGISGTLPAFAATPTFNLGTGGLGTTGSPIYTTSNTSTTGAPGAAAPAYAGQVGGAGPSGNLRVLSTDTGGRLTPAQGAVISTRTTMTASTATSIAAASSTRIGLSVFAEAALTANVYLCTTQTTGCSATSYDFLIPSGAGAGTIYTSLFAPNTAIYAFTTGTPVLVANSWAAQ